MKKILFNLGNVVAVSLMFWPLYVIFNYENIKLPIVELIISIFYCIYLYSVIDKQNRMEKVKNNYYEQLKFKKKLMSEMTDKEIVKYKDKYIENLINDLF